MRSQRLDPLLKVMQQRQDGVARDVAERERTLAEQQERLEALRRYAEEYANAQMAATSPAQLLNRRAFLDRLDSAVALQAQTVQRNQAHVDAERGRLLAASRDRQVLEQLQQRYREQEQARSNRQEQRVLDDLGARLCRRPIPPES